MKFAEKIKFAIDEFNITVNKPSFMVLSIDVVSEGVNKHRTAFMVEDIEKNIPKLQNIPLNCLFTASEMDFKAHAWTKQELKDQVAIGVVPETNNARIIEKNGKKFLRINAIVWKYLFPQAEQILKRRKNVAISMEIDPLDGYKLEGSDVTVITDWDYEAITMLGYGVTPAIDDADATVVKFSCNDDYLADVMSKYGVLNNSYSIPNNIKDNIEIELKKKQSNPNAIAQATDVFNKATLNYSEIIALKENIMSFDEDVKPLFGGDEFLKWTDAIEKERNGGTGNLEKLKELLMEKFSDNLKYVYHNETAVFCFDLDSAQYKSFEYTYEESEEDNKFAVEVEFEVVVKVEGTDVFKTEDSLAEGEMAEDSVMYSVSAYAKMKEELNACKGKLAEEEGKVEALEKEKEDYAVKTEKFEADLSKASVEKLELEEKILGFATLSADLEELDELKKFKADKEKEEKQAKVNALYAEYSELLDKKDLESLNEKVETLEFSVFEKEVKALVLPKVVANYQTLISKRDLEAKNEDGLKYNKISNEETKDKSKSDNIIDRINAIV